ncbi:MAG: hypothetical protein LW832_04500 [Parachlamydia sp.]|jgi:hypothetical protein|nr:hypothetical protein [Parachlamydia sp.]
MKVFFVLLLLCCSLELHALIDFLSVSGNPPPLNIGTAVAGFQPTAAIDSSTTYSLTTIGIGEKITGQLNTGMPAGVSLKITLQAPPGGISQGSVSLTNSPQTLVSGLPLISLLISGLTITYQLSTTVNAGPVASRSVTVILTVS